MPVGEASPRSAGLASAARNSDSLQVRPTVYPSPPHTTRTYVAWSDTTASPDAICVFQSNPISKVLRYAYVEIP